MSNDEHAAGDTWTVAVTIPMSLPDELKDSLFRAICDAAYAWEPADRDGWDIDVVGAPIEAACDRWRRRAEVAEAAVERVRALALAAQDRAGIVRVDDLLDAIDPDRPTGSAEHTPDENAEDCPRCSALGRRDLPYPWICPGTDPEEPEDTP